MNTLLSPNYKPVVSTVNDLMTASVVWGFTIGFGALTTWTAIKQTVFFYRRNRGSKRLTPYLVMIWLEIIVCFVLSIICWLFLRGDIQPSFAIFFIIATLWALQVQFLLQIIINRVSILMVDRRKASRMKWGVAAIITAINISVYCIWVPARLQVSERYIHINNVWDRCEKAIYLVVDGLLNIIFIRTVQRSLVQPGLKKYKPLVRFNSFIILVSMSMDALIIITMSLRNSFVYLQFHPLAYIVKMRIEMSMADLIASIARAQGNENTGNVFASGGSESDPSHTTRGNVSVFQPKTSTQGVVRAVNSAVGGHDSYIETNSKQDQANGGSGPYGNRRHSHDFELGSLPELGSEDEEKGEVGTRIPSPVGATNVKLVVHKQREVKMHYEDATDMTKDRHNERFYNISSAGVKDHSDRCSDESPIVMHDSNYTKAWGPVDPNSSLE